MKRVALLALLVTIGPIKAAAAEVLTIDDFKDGGFYYASPPGETTITASSTEALGHSRVFNFENNSNKYGQPMVVSIATGAGPAGAPTGQMVSASGGGMSAPPGLIYSSGFGVNGRLGVLWGKSQSLALDLGRYERLQVDFMSLTSGANFNLEAWSGSKFVVWSCNLPASPGPLSVVLTVPRSASSQMQKVDRLYLILQAASDLGVARFEAVKGRPPPAGAQECVFKG